MSILLVLARPAFIQEPHRFPPRVSSLLDPVPLARSFIPSSGIRTGRQPLLRDLPSFLDPEVYIQI
jgi:hypothetical protein